LALLACSRNRALLAPPPTPPAPVTVALNPERILRGQPSGPVVTDTETPSGRIRAAVLHHRAELQACYERLLGANPEAGGALSLQFTVETTGQLIDVTAETDAASLRPGRECMLALVRRVRVDGMRQPAQVSFPLEFQNPPLAFSVPEFVLHPRVRVEPSSVAAAVGAGSGNLTAEEARAVVETRLADLLGCYTTLLRTERRAEGTVRFELALAPDGAVTDAAADDAPEPFGPWRACATPILRDLRFRGSGRRVTLTLPFALRPREQPTPPPRAPPPAPPRPPVRPVRRPGTPAPTPPP
jgi:hypothetical protein